MLVGVDPHSVKAYRSILNVYFARPTGPEGAVGIIGAWLPGLSATTVHRATDDATIKRAAKRGHLNLICSYVGNAVRRVAHRDILNTYGYSTNDLRTA